MKRKKPSSVNATPEVSTIMSELSDDRYLKNALKKAISVLSENMFEGAQVEKRLIPKHYIKKYGVNNLYRFKLDSSRRLVYTLVFDGKGISVNILEVFPDHKKYEKRFGYN